MCNICGRLADQSIEDQSLVDICALSYYWSSQWLWKNKELELPSASQQGRKLWPAATGNLLFLERCFLLLTGVNYMSRHLGIMQLVGYVSASLVK